MDIIDDPYDSVDGLEAEAMAEVDRLAGRHAPDTDLARQAVEQAGGGVAEGFELAEEDLITHAETRDEQGNPRAAAFTPEAEATGADAVYGEADRALSSERTDDERP